MLKSLFPELDVAYGDDYNLVINVDIKETSGDFV